jgi:hypothetical protein
MQIELHFTKRCQGNAVGDFYASTTKYLDSGSKYTSNEYFKRNLGFTLTYLSDGTVDSPPNPDFSHLFV